MRNTATLARPTYRSAVPEDESTARRMALSPARLLLAGLFVVGLVFGWGLTQFLPRGSYQQITGVEYTALVAQLFQRDQNLEVARERLALFGSPDELAQQAGLAAKSGKLVVPSDASSINALVLALSGSGAAASAPADSTSAAGSAQAVAAPDASGKSSWLGPILAFVLAFGLGIVVLLRTARLSLGFLRLPSFGKPTSTDQASRTSRRFGLPGRFDPDAPRHQALSISESRLGADVEEDGDDADSRNIDLASTFGPSAPIRSTARPNQKAAGMVYQSVYRFGDDPFDEIHPIADTVSGGLIAACGLSSALKFDSLKVGGYYAFSAWIQDYCNAEELHAAGLVAPGAPEDARGKIEGWVRSAQLDTVLSLEIGATALIGTPDLAATITVVDVEFGLSGDDDDSYVTQLVLKFEVQRRVEAAAPSRELARSRR